MPKITFFCFCFFCFLFCFYYTSLTEVQNTFWCSSANFIISQSLLTLILKNIYFKICTFSISSLLNFVVTFERVFLNHTRYYQHFNHIIFTVAQIINITILIREYTVMSPWNYIQELYTVYRVSKKSTFLLTLIIEPCSLWLYTWKLCKLGILIWQYFCKYLICNNMLLHHTSEVKIDNLSHMHFGIAVSSKSIVLFLFCVLIVCTSTHT